MAGQGEAKTSPRRVSRAARLGKALELRKLGYTYEEIATALGYRGRSSAYMAVSKALEKLRVESTEEAGKVRVLEMQRLDAYLSTLGTRIQGGDRGAIETALRIMDRRARMLGLDAPEKHQVEVNVETEKQAMDALAKEIQDNKDFRAWCLKKCKEAEEAEG